MKLTPDALLLGPMALSWPNLALLVGLLVFSGLAARRGLENQSLWVLLAAVLAARVGYAASYPWPSLDAGLWAVLDIRSGGWQVLWGAVGGVLVAVGLLRQKALNLAIPAAAAVGLALLPLALQHNLRSAAASTADSAAVLGYLPTGQTQTTTISLQDLPKPVVLNFWATWCPPCRAEMPLLMEYQAKGHPIALVNAGETPQAIQSYLQASRLSGPVYIDTSGLQRQFAVSGLPTTLLLDASGKVIARHMGPLNRAQLEQLLKQPTPAH